MAKRKDGIILDEAVLDGVGEVIPVGLYDSIVVAVITSDSADGNLKFAGSNCYGVDFSESPSRENHWDYLFAAEIRNPSVQIPGDVGVELEGTDIVRYYHINVSNIKYLTAILSGRSAGKFSVISSAAKNTQS